MKTKDIELNADELIQALTEVRDPVTGRRNPGGAALRRLQIARKEPEVLLTAAEA
jgi:hypothetical protein